MTPWEHIREAERLAAKAAAAVDSERSIAWSHLALVHIELAKATVLLAEHDPTAALDRAVTSLKGRSVGRIDRPRP